MTTPLRIANCSGFYGDRLSAAQEMVDGGPIDVLTGDCLAELTMLILARTRARHPRGGYARTFVTQMEQVMGTCLDRGIKVAVFLRQLGELGAGGNFVGTNNAGHCFFFRLPLARSSPQRFTSGQS